MAENDIREKIEDKMVPVLSTEEHVFRMNSKINLFKVWHKNKKYVRKLL